MYAYRHLSLEVMAKDYPKHFQSWILKDATYYTALNTHLWKPVTNYSCQAMHDICVVLS